MAYVGSQIKSLRVFIGKKLDESFNIQTRVKGLQRNLLFFEHNAPFFDYRGGGCSQKSLTHSNHLIVPLPSLKVRTINVLDRQDH